MIEFVIRPSAAGELYRDGINVGSFVARRQALNALAAMRDELRASGQHSLIKLEPRLGRLAPNRRGD